MIMWGTVMEGNLVNLAHANVETVAKSLADVGVVLILKDHADAGTILVLENRVVKVTLIPENHVYDGIIHVRSSMLTGV